MKTKTSIFYSVLAAAILLILSGSALAEKGGRGADVHKLEVMTQNLYVGADVFRVFEGAPCGPMQAIYEIFGTVQQTDFPTRAEAIADIVMRNKPHVIGLQEVSLIRMQVPADGEVDINPSPDPSLPPTLTYVPNAKDVVFDYLQLLVDALAARGLDYVVVEDATAIDADVEFPMASFDGECNMTSVPMDLRLTDRDVVLVRGDLATANAMSKNFGINLPVQIPDPATGLDFTLEFTRGYGALDVTLGDDTYRVVNTHLEVGDDADPPSPLNLIQGAQAMELLADIVATPLPLVVVGDINSSPMALDPRPAYGLLSQAGFLDLWSVRQGPYSPGFTCCQAEDLANPVSFLDERIDVVFARLPAGSRLLPIRAKVVGDSAREKSASDTWPSDHAGVTATLKFRSR
jgi:endonuclease/exonuclease/phosphatase family metal-dependent hydrolase